MWLQIPSQISPGFPLTNIVAACTVFTRGPAHDQWSINYVFAIVWDTRYPAYGWSRFGQSRTLTCSFKWIFLALTGALYAAPLHLNITIRGGFHLENTVIFPENSEFWIPPLKESDAPIFSDQENQDWLRPPLFSGKKWIYDHNMQKLPIFGQCTLENNTLECSHLRNASISTILNHLDLPFALQGSPRICCVQH